MTADLPSAKPLYQTRRGTAYVGDSLTGMQEYLEDGSVTLCMTSPPYPLLKGKEYGNKPVGEYIDWFKDFAKIIWDKLTDDGSFVVDLGGTWTPGAPIRSLYQFKLLIELCEGLGDKPFFLAQDFYWHNPSKMPLPAQWVTVDRSRVKDSVNVIWWLSKSERPKADNRNVLRAYSKDMLQLLEKQDYNHGRRPGGARVSADTWKKEHKGAIPPSAFELPFSPASANGDADAVAENFLRHGGSESASRYHRAMRAIEDHYEGDADLRERARKHPARFPLQIPSFFIEFLTEEGDLVVDAFAGSNVTGQAAESLDRKWAAFELHRHYLEPSIARFDSYFAGDAKWLDETPPALDGVSEETLARHRVS